MLWLNIDYIYIILYVEPYLYVVAIILSVAIRSSAFACLVTNCIYI